MQHKIPHDLSPEDAKKAAEAAIAAYAERFSKYDPQTCWTSDTEAEISFQAKGVKLKGNVCINASDISMDLKVPMVFKLIKKKALAVIEEEVERWVQKAKTGDL